MVDGRVPAGDIAFIDFGLFVQSRLQLLTGPFGGYGMVSGVIGPGTCTRKQQGCGQHGQNRDAQPQYGLAGVTDQHDGVVLQLQFGFHDRSPDGNLTGAPASRREDPDSKQRRYSRVEVRQKLPKTFIFRIINRK
ncbi:hypothetical protein D3C76_1203630 [compost metagenome]